MLMADTMSIFFVILGMLLAFSGLWLLCRGLWPDAVAAAADRCGKRLWSSFLAGLPVTIVMIVLTKTLFNVLGPVGKIAGVGVVRRNDSRADEPGGCCAGRLGQCLCSTGAGRVERHLTCRWAVVPYRRPLARLLGGQHSIWEPEWRRRNCGACDDRTAEQCSAVE